MPASKLQVLTLGDVGMMVGWIQIWGILVIASACNSNDPNIEIARQPAVYATSQATPTPMPTSTAIGLPTTSTGPGPTITPDAPNVVVIPQQPNSIVPSNAVQPSVPQSQCTDADPFICSIELAIIQQTNEIRAAGGKAAQKRSDKMSYAARKWSEEQARRGDIGHEGFSEAREATIVTRFGSMGTTELYAENVAYSGASGTNAEEIAREFTTMWRNSSGHYRNMMGNYSYIGAGIVRKGTRTYYATQIFGKE